MLYAGRKQLERYDPGVGLEVVVPRKDLPATGDRGGTNQKVSSGSGNPARSALIAPSGRLFVVVRRKRLAGKSPEVGLQSLKLSRVSNSGKQFLADRSDKAGSAVLNEVAKGRGDSFFGIGYLRPGPSQCQMLVSTRTCTSASFDARPCSRTSGRSRWFRIGPESQAACDARCIRKARW
jgi:hypothetical protein